MDAYLTITLHYIDNDWTSYLDLLLGDLIEHLKLFLITGLVLLEKKEKYCNVTEVAATELILHQIEWGIELGPCEQKKTWRFPTLFKTISPITEVSTFYVV